MRCLHIVLESIECPEIQSIFGLYLNVQRLREKTSKRATTYHRMVLKLTSKSIQSLYRFQITLTAYYKNTINM